MHDMITICPHCKKRNELMTEARGHGDLPARGNHVFCFKCGKFSIFEPEAIGHLRPPGKLEMRRIARDNVCLEVMMMWMLHA